MKKPRRILPATELRVHLGEALRSLEAEDLVIEKGGVPVALLIKYRAETEEPEPAREAEYERAVAKRAEPGGRERMDAVMASGWAGIEAEELAANVYRWREEGATGRFYSLDEPAEAEDDERQVPDRQRHLYPRRAQGKRVAEPDAPGYTP
jgi:antitoxin (DNA-binding transcriptional repressor) of toxin-antitoxin stability system